MALIHASCVRYKDKGILIMGESGTGKSDLALRLMDEGAILISDDYVDVTPNDGKAIANTPPTIEGLIEVRGIGLVKSDYENQCELGLVLELCNRDEIDRLPEAAYFDVEDVKIPLYKFDAFAASAIAKINLLIRNE